MKRVLIGLSGGVDSACAALQLQQSGYEVFGVYCRMHDVAPEEEADARRVAEFLGISLSVLDLREAFEREVVSDFLENYRNGRTPNPCIVCNPRVKFAGLCEEADRLCIPFVATGHYADVTQVNGRWAIKAAPQKDQSYMLYRLPQEILARLILPLGDEPKETLRARAAQGGIPVAEKKDSQDLCFIRGESYREFVTRRLGAFPPGDFYLEEENRVVGRHGGLIGYTVGQRKNLGIALGTPVYVRRLEPETNRVVLSRADVTDFSSLTLLSPVFQGAAEDVFPISAFAKIRFSSKTAPCRAEKKDGKLTVYFDSPQRAVTPGQSCVLYDENGCVLCGGRIE